MLDAPRIGAASIDTVRNGHERSHRVQGGSRAESCGLHAVRRGAFACSYVQSDGRCRVGNFSRWRHQQHDADIAGRVHDRLQYGGHYAPGCCKRGELAKVTHRHRAAARLPLECDSSIETRRSSHGAKEQASGGCVRGLQSCASWLTLSPASSARPVTIVPSAKGDGRKGWWRGDRSTVIGSNSRSQSITP